ncbi:Voltage-gated Ion Channel (VIC) Superfamily [Achlya hypogyna]|uniref:BK channel n=1 Tax=Achlya hypogyna TaxID=1202772 RepID=A0A1V9YJY5_ACHHY|nr:Voltage-gated Ion Channel (VIC) Superfamily [Achlya hypogyna]
MVKARDALIKGFGQAKRYVGKQLRKLVKARMRGETFRKWVGRNIDNSLLASFIDVVQVILGLVVTIIYFQENWLVLNTSATTDANIDGLQLGISIFFTFDYLVQIYASDNRRSFFFSPFSLVDLVTILPQWFETILDKLNIKTYQTTSSALKTLRSLRFLRAFRLLAFSKTAKHRQMGVLCLTVMGIIVCSAGIIQAIEACGDTTIVTLNGTEVIVSNEGNCQNMEIYNACYFVVITIATLGYGDIAPKSQNGKLAVIGLIIWTGILLPLQISKLSDVLSRETEYDKSFKERKEKNPHILICGEVNSGALDFFLRQFLHPNNMNWKDKVVILCPSLPSHNLKRILLNGAYEQRVVYLQGSAMLDSDLKRASAATARLCFVMINKLSTDGDQSDTASNLLTISLRHYTRRVPLFVQVLKTDNIRHVHLSGANNIVCIDQVKLGILAKSCLIPGLCAFLCNILFTFRPLYTQSTLWAAEFLDGCCNDIYEAHPPAFLNGLISYRILAYVLYQEIQAVPLAVCDNAYFELCLFPARMLINKTHTMFVLCKHPDCVRRIEGLSFAVLQKYHTVIPNFDAIMSSWNSGVGSIKTRLRSMAQRSSVTRTASLIVSQISKHSRSGSIPHETRIVPCGPDDPKPSSDDGDDDDEDVFKADEPAAVPAVDAKAAASLAANTKPSAEASATTNRPAPLEVPHHTPGVNDLPPLKVHKEPALSNDLVPRSMSSILDISTEIPTAEVPPSEVPPTEVPPVATKPRLSVEYAAPAPDPRRRSYHERNTVTRFELQPAPAQDEGRSSIARTYELFLLTRIPHDVRNHIILCGMPNMLHDFVAPLREMRLAHSSQSMPNVLASSHLSNAIPIVIVSPLPITEKQHGGIAAYEQVYYLQASPLHEITLREAQVYQAANVVILSSCTRTSVDDNQEQTLDFIDQNMIDTDAITLHRFITEACENNCAPGAPMPKITIELSRPSSLRFLKDEHAKLDSAEDAREIRQLTRQVISRADDPLDNICSPLYAAGKVFISNSLDAILGSCNTYGSIIDLFHLLVLGEPQGLDAMRKTRCLDQIAVPAAYWSKPYGLCYQEMLLKHEILCVAVYRARTTNTSFVSMNPLEETLLSPQDKLFVIH